MDWPTLFGSGTDLTIAQMAFRGAAVFVLTLLLLRVSGRRSFGQHRAFDTCTLVLLGSILSRAVDGSGHGHRAAAPSHRHRELSLALVRKPGVRRQARTPQGRSPRCRADAPRPHHPSGPRRG